jgi:hypothetical protein
MMTVGREVWLDFFKEYQLQYFIKNGGSKVKFLIGSKGIGKTHLVRSVLYDAKQENYVTVYLSANEYKLNNLVSFYHEIIGQIDLDLLIQDICCVVAKNFGFDRHQYDGSEVFIPMIYPQYPNTQMAISEFGKKVSQIVREYDFLPSFQAFIYQVTRSRMVENNLDKIRLLKRWLSAAYDVSTDEKKQFKDLCLYDKLQRFNARDWIISLIQLVKLSGKKGLVVGIDNLDILIQKNPDTNRYFYTKNAVTDVYEILRQLIDDTEILEYFLLLVSGDRSLIENLERGFRSYDALWIRLQTGLAASDKFNSLADLLDIDKYFETQQSNNQFLNLVYERLHLLLINIESSNTYHRPPIPNNYLEKYTSLQQRIIEATCLKGGHL